MASIPKQEYFDRIAKLQANMKKAGLDACLVHGTESDFANVRYLTEYWPTFEQAGVFVPAEGEAILLIGPESLKYAQGRSVVPNIMQLLVYRESAEPDYPGIPLATFADVAKKGMGKKKLKKLGLVGTAVMNIKQRRETTNSTKLTQNSWGRASGLSEKSTLELPESFWKLAFKAAISAAFFDA